MRVAAEAEIVAVLPWRAAVHLQDGGESALDFRSRKCGNRAINSDQSAFGSPINP